MHVTLGADYLATGHYAQVEYRDGEYKMLRGIDNNKDQTYFLNQLTQDQLEKVMFHSDILKRKKSVKLRKKQGLATATKKDSQGFVLLVNVISKSS